MDTAWTKTLFWVMTLLRRFLVISLVILGCCSISESQVFGAGELLWDEPIKIAGPGLINYPDLVVNQNGEVNFFYSQGTSETSLDHAIYFRNFDGEMLSTPIDVLVTPGSVDARTPSAVLDQVGNVHVVWVGGTDIWYSRAVIAEAGNAASWSKPTLLDGPTASNTRPALVLANGMELSLAYIIYGENPGIYVIESKNGGLTWEAPERVVDPQIEGLAPVSLSMCIDQLQGSKHIVWYEGDIYSNGLAAQEIYYIRQPGDLNSWADPDRFDSVSTGNYEDAYGPAMPSIACNQSSIYIYWYGAPMGQRHFRYSLDHGENWRDIGQVSDFRGLTYPAALAFDRNGWLYVASGSLDNRLMFMVFDNQSWENGYPIDTNSMGPHYPRMVSENGKKLHVIWQEVITNEIWYRQGVISAIAELPTTPQGDVGAIEQALPTTPISSPTSLLVEENPISPNIHASDSTGTWKITPNDTILFSSAAVLMVFVVVFIAIRFKIGSRS